MQSKAFLGSTMLLVLLTSCGDPSTEGIQSEVARSFFMNPNEVEFSDVYRSGKTVCGFAAGRVRQDTFLGPRPFMTESDGALKTIISAEYPEGFLINAARNCPRQFVDLLHDVPYPTLRKSLLSSNGQGQND